MDVETGKPGGLLVNRGKRRQVKYNIGVAWGKLLSQCSQVGLCLFTIFHVLFV